MKQIALCVVCMILFSLNASGAVDSTGIKLLRDGKLQQAQAFFEAAAKSNPRDPEVKYNLAWSLLRQGKFDDAEDAIDEALELDENVSKYHYTRGAVLGERAMRANVISQGLLAPKIKNAFKRAAELDPKNLDAHIGLFNYYMQAPGFMGGSDEKGFEEGKIVVALNAYRGHLMLAGYYANKKDVANADAEYQKMIAADPKNTDGRYRYGIFLVNQKRYDDALAQFGKILDVDPKSSQTNYLYGRGMYNMERWDKAMEKFQYVLYVEKNDPPAIWMLANCYEKRGMTVKAKETYQWLLQVEPNGHRADMAREKLKSMQ
jgi:tetratricopeptide (TPR) repeat protein